MSSASLPTVCGLVVCQPHGRPQACCLSSGYLSSGCLSWLLSTLCPSADWPPGCLSPGCLCADGRLNLCVCRVTACYLAGCLAAGCLPPAAYEFAADLQSLASRLRACCVSWLPCHLATWLFVTWLSVNGLIVGVCQPTACHLAVWHLAAFLCLLPSAYDFAACHLATVYYLPFCLVCELKWLSSWCL